MTRLSLEAEIGLVRGLCRDLGLGEVEPRLLKAGHHSSLHIAPLALVARVQSDMAADEARVRAAKELALARHVSARCGPVVPALEAELAGPHDVMSSIVTFWPFLAGVRSAAESEMQFAAAALASLHRALADYGGTLPPFTDALDRCSRALVEIGSTGALPLEDRLILETQLARLRAVVESSVRQWCPLHGDAHLGNLLVQGSAPLWADLEDACYGPRELDIAGLPEAAWTSFPGADLRLIENSSHLRSVCVAIWCWRDPLRSADMHEAAQYHLDRVRNLWTRSGSRANAGAALTANAHQNRLPR